MNFLQQQANVPNDRFWQVNLLCLVVSMISNDADNPDSEAHATRISRCNQCLDSLIMAWVELLTLQHPKYRRVWMAKASPQFFSLDLADSPPCSTDQKVFPSSRSMRKVRCVRSSV
ncbi:hypothetical protein AVEN_121812-1 [Araneus ventricosus]|uniref:Uncharacterized protein n=2 Tax=Araneus ventricosus TaxID=182803 RepID=A0A4Y2B059_ARAVE|nr:hypothetical protein AVEN_208155-1 [Araneus ventricosus]GBN00837.1 hypothetical protein AVEN_121812-1 [Araneus ventricosus]